MTIGDPSDLTEVQEKLLKAMEGHEVHVPSSVCSVPKSFYGDGYLIGDTVNVGNTTGQITAVEDGHYSVDYGNVMYPNVVDNGVYGVAGVGTAILAWTGIGDTTNYTTDYTLLVEAVLCVLKASKIDPDSLEDLRIESGRIRVSGTDLAAPKVQINKILMDEDSLVRVDVLKWSFIPKQKEEEDVWGLEEVLQVGLRHVDLTDFVGLKEKK